MTAATNNSEVAELARAVESLRLEVAALTKRTVALETAALERAPLEVSTARPAQQPTQLHGAIADTAGVSEELMLVISAAIAAYLGVRPRIRQIVLVQSHPWSQQGRVTIQASHALAAYHG